MLYEEISKMEKNPFSKIVVGRLVCFAKTEGDIFTFDICTTQDTPMTRSYLHLHVGLDAEGAWGPTNIQESLGNGRSGLAFLK